MLLLAALLAPLTVQLTGRAEVELAGAEVRLGDVAVPVGGSQADRARLARLVIARLPRGQRAMAVSRRGLSDLIARRAGVIVAAAPHEGAVELRRAAAPPAVRPCWVTAVPVAVGAAVMRADVEEAPCREARAALRFDRDGRTLRALDELPAGAELGTLAVEELSTVSAESSVMMSSASGPVTVSRPVRTLQASRAGRRIFVQDADGAVFSAPVEAQPEARP